MNTISGERKKCTKEALCDRKGRWYHPEAVMIESEDDISWYRCPVCKLVFGETVPD